MKKLFKSRKSSPSLRRYIFIYLMTMILIMVAAYSIILQSYFVQGVILSNSYPLEITANTFAEKYQEDPNTTLPSSGNMYSYIGEENLPDLVKEIFRDKEKSSGKMITEFWWPEDAEHHDNDNMHILLLMPYDLHDGKRLFLLVHANPNERAKYSGELLQQFANTVWPIAAMFLLFFLVGTLFLNRKIGREIKTIATWAEQLNLQNKNERPNFSYQELDSVAERLQDAFHRISHVMEREHNFLRHASHELRTPIAVLSSNIELINRAYQEHLSTDKVRPPWLRIERAVLNMQQMTETLLWLSREAPIDQQPVTIDVADMLQEMCRENNYLLQDKAVQLTMTLQPLTITTAATPLRITLNNLVRNAFQYTQEGTVCFKITDSSVIIENRDTGFHSANHDGRDYGFGLGIRLVEQICQQMNWQFNSEEIDGGRRATIVLLEQTAEQPISA